MTRLIILILAAFASSAFGQGAHNTYPFTVVCPDGVVVAGVSATVTAEFEGGYTGDKYAPNYNWSVSAGTIVTGQGTPSITVEVGRQDNGALSVTLERTFMEAHFPEVQRSASCTFGVVPLPQARMIDEFRTGGKNCEEGFARLDAFFNELANNPMDEGLIVIYGDTRDSKAAGRRAKQLSNHFTFRKFDRSRVRFVRGIERDGGATQFWMVPVGADLPKIDEASDATNITPPTQPYLYATEYIDGVAGCFGNLYDLAEYAKVLQAEPKSSGRIVIGQSSQAKYRGNAREVIAELSGHGVARNRIVTVYKYVRPNRLLEVTELWVIPPKRSTSVGWIADDGTELTRRCPATTQYWRRAC